MFARLVKLPLQDILVKNAPAPWTKGSSDAESEYWHSGKVEATVFIGSNMLWTDQEQAEKAGRELPDSEKTLEEIAVMGPQNKELNKVLDNASNKERQEKKRAEQDKHASDINHL